VSDSVRSGAARCGPVRLIVIPNSMPRVWQNRDCLKYVLHSNNKPTCTESRKHRS